MDEVLGYVERRLELGPEHSEAWSELAGAVREGTEMLGEARRGWHEDAPPASAQDALSRLELSLTTAAAAVRRLRPHFESFHATLDPGQRRTLDDLLTGRRMHYTSLR
jgi:hypothetical protein